jgi:Fe-S-cluster containining protein
LGKVDLPMIIPSPDPSIIIPQLDDHQSRPLMEKMARLFRQIGALKEVERFRQDLSLPYEAQRLSQRAYRLYDEYLVYALRKLQKKGWQIYCAPGCAACCFSMPAGISSWELLLIYDHLQQAGQLSIAFRRNLESCQVLSRVSGQLLDGWTRKGTEDKSMYEKLLHDYSWSKHPCAFQTEAQECEIYSVRPLACRMHFAFTPPELCDPAHPQFPQAVRLNLSPHDGVEETLQELDSRLKLNISDLLAPGLVSLTANVLRFSPILWL